MSHTLYLLGIRLGPGFESQTFIPLNIAHIKGTHGRILCCLFHAFSGVPCLLLPVYDVSYIHHCYRSVASCFRISPEYFQISSGNFHTHGTLLSYKMQTLDSRQQGFWSWFEDGTIRWRHPWEFLGVCRFHFRRRFARNFSVSLRGGMNGSATSWRALDTNCLQNFHTSVFDFHSGFKRSSRIGGVLVVPSWLHYLCKCLLCAY